MLFTTSVLAALVASVAAKDGRTFAVLHHYGKGPLVTVRADPIISPGTSSSHLHTVMGASNFGLNATGETLAESTCTTALIKGDKSAYWFPTLFFQDPKTGKLEQVEMFYMNVYYFFEGTNDKIQAFPLGLQMLSGNAALRTAPVTTGKINQDPSNGPIQPTQWTCPRGNFNPPSWPAGSDGSMAGIQDPNNKGSGMGFPFQVCDGYASPLRMDLHFPSCYNPAAGLTNYKNNMAWPTDAGNGKQDCPAGYIHTPHIFYEVYWNTPKLSSRWTVDGKTQPFVLANGDRTGFSAHGDFISGWDTTVLQQIIDNCDAGDSGMDKCPGLLGGLNDPSTSCNINPMINEVTTGVLDALPGNNPLAGWGVGNVGTGGGSTPTTSTTPAAPTSTKPAATSDAPAPTSSADTQPAQSSDEPAPTSSIDLGVTKPIDTSTSAATGGDSAPTSVVLNPGTGESSTPAAGGGDAVTSTIWDTVTVWRTTTVYDGAAPTSVADAVSTPAATSTAAPASDVAGWAYAGCYKDNGDRVLAGKIRPNLGKVSNTNCVEYCQEKGWSFAGTEYGGQCYCGNSFASIEKLDESECDMTCEGEASQTCGGGWALSVFSADGLVAPVTNGTVADAKMRRHLHGHMHRAGSFHRRR